MAGDAIPSAQRRGERVGALTFIPSWIRGRHPSASAAPSGAVVLGFQVPVASEPIARGLGLALLDPRAGGGGPPDPALPLGAHLRDAIRARLDLPLGLGRGG